MIGEDYLNQAWYGASPPPARGNFEDWILATSLNGKTGRPDSSDFGGSASFLRLVTVYENI